MRAMKSIAAFFALLFASTVTFAGEDYRCVVERVSLAGGDIGPTFDAYTGFIGKEFTVERASGVMAGVLKNSYATKPQVIDRGSKENSFKVVTTMRIDQGAGRGSNVYVLNVLEYEDSERKPFVFLGNGAVFFGHCVYF